MQPLYIIKYDKKEAKELLNNTLLVKEMETILQTPSVLEDMLGITILKQHSFSTHYQPASDDHMIRAKQNAPVQNTPIIADQYTISIKKNEHAIDGTKTYELQKEEMLLIYALAKEGFYFAGKINAIPLLYVVPSHPKTPATPGEKEKSLEKNIGNSFQQKSTNTQYQRIEEKRWSEEKNENEYEKRLEQLRTHAPYNKIILSYHLAQERKIV
ncbi:MAG: hypothetical protein QW594_02480 [Candidatus Woesearchaeota archaeon]